MDLCARLRSLMGIILRNQHSIVILFTFPIMCTRPEGLATTSLTKLEFNMQVISTFRGNCASQGTKQIIKEVSDKLSPEAEDRGF